MTPEERQYKAGTWILGLTFSVIVWAIVICTVLYFIGVIT
ncbi:hypothetical protein LCGC14_2136210 [marine sediment metagenome]|uniref:Uncharacterized protein n=1 Tax=marine sediment metagenome TaxID=412755 RepID=A0A0F9E002_9ZZZZ